MTKHNLDSSLSWLLNYQHPTHLNLEHTALPTELDSPLLTGYGQHIDGAEAMARLQLAPQTTNRSRLLSHKGPAAGIPTQTPSRSASEIAAAASTSRSNQAKQEVSSEEDAQSFRTPETTFDRGFIGQEDSVLDIDDIDHIDLTGDNPTTSSFGDFGEPVQLWEEKAAARVDPLPTKKGKKRKSDEYQEDLMSPEARAARRAEKRPAVSETCTELDEETGFVATQDTARPKSFQRMSLDHDGPSFDVTDSHQGPQGDHSRPVKEEQSSSQLDAKDEVGMVPDSDGEDGLSPVKKSRSSPIPATLPPTSTVNPSIGSCVPKTESQNGPLETESCDRPSALTPFDVNTIAPTPSFVHRVASPANSSPSIIKLTDQQRAIVARFMRAQREQLDRFIARLNKSRTDTNKEMAEQIAEEGVASVDLKQRKKLIATRLEAGNRLVELRHSYAKILVQKEEKKGRLAFLLDQGEDPDEAPEGSEMHALCVLTRSLKVQGDSQEFALFQQLQLAGLGSEGAFPSPSLLSAEHPSRIQVASTQKLPARSPWKDSLISPSGGQTHSVIQTPLQNSDRLLWSPSRPANAALASPTPQRAMDSTTFQSSSRHRVPDASTATRDFTTNMGSPARSMYSAAEFDEDFGDEEDLRDAVDAFEQSYAGLGAEVGSSSLSRPPLGEISDNIRRSKPSDNQVMKPPTASMKQYAWTKEVLSALKKRFHLQGFRHNQLEAIDATLGGKDAFVLMPTGGGKSLCYQLPSVVQTGRTKGVTVVVSPLLSLMQDQVDHLQKLQIQAQLINGECTSEHKKMVMQALRGPNPERLIQLLYVTPEMLNKSVAIENCFRELHQKQRLARIVIDEAHCVSQWGHDFRPDYKELGELRRKFPGVPVMALTATATENVKVDVIHNLGMNGCQTFTQSFNRANLSYEVRAKDKKTLDDMAETINTHHAGQSGIIYCLSRKQCEQVAQKLRDNHGINASHYHAGMESVERSTTQKNWQKGTYKVIVATIAFGMGIDKPDVRYVIHHTIPKSLEGYYQETGRAGRDGSRSLCYLYYGCADSGALKRMISDGEGDALQKERQMRMLRNVVAFCENRVDCRRVQVLAYFNESFSAEDCHATCDNCAFKGTVDDLEMITHAQNVLRLVGRLERDNVTIHHCVDVYRGQKNAKSREKGHDQLEQYGRGSDIDRGTIERIFYKLLLKDALREQNVNNGLGFPIQYVRLGPAKDTYFHRGATMNLQIRRTPHGKPKAQPTLKPNKTKRASATGVKAAADDHPASTNVSSPLQARSTTRVRRNLVESDSEEDDLGDFEPVRKAGITRKRKSHEMGPPITTDEKMAQLDETHRHVLEDFVEKAREGVNKIMAAKSLRRRPVSDRVLREIAIAFPKTADEIRAVDGMTDDMYANVGLPLLKLVKSSYDDYDALMRAQEDSQDDTNEGDVVEISDDEDNDSFIAAEDFEDNDMENEESESSRYFSASAEVDRFNSQMSQIQTLSKKGKGTGSKKPPSRSRGSSSFRGGRGGKRNSATRTYKAKGKSTTGVTKRKKASTASRSSAGNTSISSYASKKTGGAAASGIGMMPT